ncbi:MAG: cobalamin B12-binding domain-containing protein, partial [Kiloniellales bacterium]|nr:cobalamin B12-binding domain-containing protein [Kiloniellales bacterium]
IVEELIGGKLAHCYGHSFSHPLTRMAFHLALSKMPGAPGSMVYGNTVSYRDEGEGASHAGNYASLAAYLTIDAFGQNYAPTGHAINPVPVSEALRIPDIDEIIEAQLFALRLTEGLDGLKPLICLEEADLVAERIVKGGTLFKRKVLAGLASAGIDTENPFELLLSLRRIGSKRLEVLFGPGDEDDNEAHGRKALVKASTIEELEKKARDACRPLSEQQLNAIAATNLRLCIGSSDVHEYGKLTAEAVCRHLSIEVIDGGIHAEPEDLVTLGIAESADALVIATYNGVALDYLKALHDAFKNTDTEIPILIGGRLNQIDPDSNSNLPRDVTPDLRTAGAITCNSMADFAIKLADLAKERKS